MILVSIMFFALYIAGVIILHKGLRPLTETAGLIRDFLPERKTEHPLPITINTQTPETVSTWSGDPRLRADFDPFPYDAGAGILKISASKDAPR
jgi:hypothetical protein